MARDINFGADETDAKYQISDDGTPGDFVLARDTNGAVVLLQWNATAGQWEYGGPVDLNGNDLEDGAATVYDASTDTVGDGTNTSADHTSVSTDEAAIGGHTSVKGVETGTVTQNGADNSGGGSGWDTSAEVTTTESFSTAFGSEPDVAIAANGDAGGFANAFEGVHYLTNISTTGFTYRNRQYAANDRSGTISAIDYVAVEQ